MEIVNLLKNEQSYLLSAMFNINGNSYRVMIDTGASISCLPELGKVLRDPQTKLESANILVQVADGNTVHLRKRARVVLKPEGSSVRPKEVLFYIQPKERDIFGYDALLGLKHLMMFDIKIEFRDEKILMSHENHIIGHESCISKGGYFTLKVIDNLSSCHGDSNIQRVINKYKGVFADLDDNPIKGKPMKFETFHQRPVAAKTRNYTSQEAVLMKEHIQGLLEKRIIEPTESGYSAQSRIIPKANGTPRLVINYIPLNLVTRRNSYTLPNITDIINVLAGKNYLSTMDCTSGFYQINVDWRDRHKTAFSTSCGNFQFRRCPFGAKNSGAVFQANMDRIFRDGLLTRCVVYVDDILVFGKDRKEHDDNLEWVLNKCDEFNVKLKLDKCVFAQKEVKYLGYLVSGAEIKPIPSKVDKIRGIRPPQNKRDLQSLLGKLNFYSRFIKNYSKLLEPIRSLLSKDRDFQWSDKQQESLNRIVAHLSTCEPQQMPALNEPKTIHLHIESDSIEVILLSAEARIVRRASRLLLTPEINYSFTEKQLLGLILALKKFRTLLMPGKFKILTPDKCLEKIYKLMHRPERIDNLMLRIPPEFDELEFEMDTTLPVPLANRKPDHLSQEIFYVDGACRKNGKPDCQASWAVCCEYEPEFEATGIIEEEPSNNTAELTAAIKACEIAKEKGYSQISIVTDSAYCHSAATKYIESWKNDGWRNHRKKPLGNEKLFRDLLDAKEGLQIEWIHVKGHSNSIGNCRADMLARALLEKKTAILCAIGRPVKKLQHECEEINSIRDEIMANEQSKFIEREGTVYYVDDKLPESNRLRIYVPTYSRGSLLNIAHDDYMTGGHSGIRKTSLKLIRFWWPKMRRDIEEYIKSCELCQMFKGPKGLPPGCLNSIPVSRIFQNLHVDMVGPLKTTVRANQYIITATDAFSKWAFAFACQKIKTCTVIKFIEEFIIAVHGSPDNIITDRGSQFTSEEWRMFVDKFGIKHKMTTAYHPQTNGTDERFNGTLVKILKNYVDDFHGDWDIQMKWALHTYNTAIHESTGYSPFQVLFGRDCRSALRPIESEQVNCDTEIQNQDYIHENVRERVIFAQRKQKEYYDKHRRPVNLKKGQLVKIKVHTVHPLASRKFNLKWEGPKLIVGFVGDEGNPRAVKILDHEAQKPVVKIVSIQDVSPYYMREWIDNKQNEGDGQQSTDEIDSRESSETMLYDVDINYNDYNPISSRGNESNGETVQPIDTSETLRFEPRASAGPMSSSPRRVTINDRVTMRTYERDPDQSFVPFSNMNIEYGDLEQETSTVQVNDSSHQTPGDGPERTTSDERLISFDEPIGEGREQIQWKSLNLSEVTLPDPDTSSDQTFVPKSLQANQPAVEEADKPEDEHQETQTRIVTRSQTRKRDVAPQRQSLIPLARRTSDTSEQNNAVDSRRTRSKRLYDRIATLIGIEDEEDLLNEMKLIDCGKSTCNTLI